MGFGNEVDTVPRIPLLSLITNLEDFPKESIDLLALYPRFRDIVSDGLVELIDQVLRCLGILGYLRLLYATASPVRPSVSRHRLTANPLDTLAPAGFIV